MDISRAAKKREAGRIEELAQELIELGRADMAALPADEALKKELRDAKDLKAGARKRQLKYIAKELRRGDPEPLLAFLARRKGSKLQQDQEFKGLEQVRDAIIAEAIDAQREKETEGLPLQEQDWESPTLAEALERWPELARRAIHQAATRFAMTRKPNYKRDIFRQLKAAKDRQQFKENEVEAGGEESSREEES
jgi:ribosome-associated protein